MTVEPGAAGSIFTHTASGCITFCSNNRPLDSSGWFDGALRMSSVVAVTKRETERF